jgi:hypothetical protein
MVIIPAMKIGPLPSRPDARQKALALFTESTSSYDTGDEPESVDAFVTFETERLDEFRRFVRDHNLPKADYLTWINLFAKDWQNVDGDYLSMEEIAEFASREPAAS